MKYVNVAKIEFLEPDQFYPGRTNFWLQKLVRPDQIRSTKIGPAGPIFAPDQFFRYSPATAALWLLERYLLVWSG